MQKAIGDYVDVYEKAVDETYAKANPWDYESGKGIVVVPDKFSLLRPSAFDPANPPSLNKVWMAQERLWIQSTLLDAVAKINGKAKDWNGAVVKQINMLEVGSPRAQDQKSLVEGKTVKVSDEIVPPGGTPASAAPAGGEGGGDPTRVAMQTAGMSGGVPGMGSGGLSAVTEDVYHLDVPSTQFTIVPVAITALVDQNRLQEFLVGLENSPMAIQVLEFEMLKPTNPVTKPEKGEAPAGMMGGSMMPPGMGGDPRMRLMGNKGGGRGMPPGMGMGGGAESNASFDPGRMAGMMRGGYSGGSGGFGSGAGKKGTDVRTKDYKKAREDREKKRKALGRAVDTYYDIVEVSVFGQARFYNPPPPPPPVEAASPGEPSAEPAKAEEAKPTDAAKAGETKPADAAKTDETKPADAAKADEAKKADEKPGEPKADEASKKEEAKLGEAVPAESKPAEAPKSEAKPESKPAEPPKAEAKPAEPAPAPKA